MPNKKDYSGQKIGRVTVDSFNRTENGKSYWNCICDCGNRFIKRIDSLLAMKRPSCGCWDKEFKSRKRPDFHSSFIDIAGQHQKEGRLTALYRLPNKYGKSGSQSTMWQVRCDCGKEFALQSHNFIAESTKSCGCYAKEITVKTHLIDLTGKKFGKWTVLRRSKNRTFPNGQQAPTWLCECECGTIREVFGLALRNGESYSCGCIGPSKGEFRITEWFSHHHIVFEHEKQFSDLVSKKGYPLRFDFCVPDCDGNVCCLIEFQGEQHYIPQATGFGDQQREVTDKQKREYCIKHSYPLFEIKYDENIESRLFDIMFHELCVYDNTVLISDQSEKV